ncbi:serine/threonine-protein kinase [Actinocorallia sp. A-T 12471]|uniref:serine/threonine-protein kinase n=1 Tax=Actinocorallia sp. A-T 12471 TaxID=3089813 RepID=UPI0029CD323A|nr:protein kinase [Actinocorallia sp. A-T 12471]MDX6742759.1 protein kinase [Actinocorallia sp. A-T 12471]
MSGNWRLDGYDEQGELGAGQQGRVVLARRAGSDDFVAIKYMDAGHAMPEDADERTLLRHEARMLVEVSDEHVARLYDVVESPHGVAMVMEAVDGVALKVILAEHGALPPEAALVVLRGSLLGLEAAHAAGVVHRDYKPANVIVRQDGVSKLIDFGIATHAGRRSLAGTPAYMAPEQWRGDEALPPTDVYAATVTFFECVTGRRPFAGPNRLALMDQHLNAYPPLYELPEGLRPLVAHGLAKGVYERPPSAAAFLAELEAAALGAYGKDWRKRGALLLGGVAATFAGLFPLALTGLAGGTATSALVAGGAGGGTSVGSTAFSTVGAGVRGGVKALMGGGGKAIAIASVAAVAAAATVVVVLATDGDPVPNAQPTQDVVTFVPAAPSAEPGGDPTPSPSDPPSSEPPAPAGGPAQVPTPAPGPSAPAPGNPDPGNPNPGDPDPGDPDLVDPDPDPVDPGPAAPGPGPAGPGPAGPGPGPVDPGPVDPGPVDPGPVDPGPVDPGPGPVDPGPVDPGTGPGPVDPGPGEPEPVECAVVALPGFAFGEVGVGQVETTTVTFPWRDCYAGDPTAPSVTLKDASPAYSVTAVECPTEGGDCTATVRFAPATLGEHTATLVVAADDGSDGLTFALSGSASFTCQPYTASYRLGSVAQGGGERTVGIRYPWLPCDNEEGLTVEGDPGFSARFGECEPNDQGAYCTIYVTFTATKETRVGTHTATVVIPDDAGRSETVRIAVSVQVTAASNGGGTSDGEVVKAPAPTDPSDGTPTTDPVPDQSPKGSDAPAPPPQEPKPEPTKPQPTQTAETDLEPTQIVVNQTAPDVPDEEPEPTPEPQPEPQSTPPATPPAKPTSPEPQPSTSTSEG